MFIGQTASVAFVAGSQTGKFGHEEGVPWLGWKVWQLSILFQDSSTQSVQHMTQVSLKRGDDLGGFRKHAPDWLAACVEKLRPFCDVVRGATVIDLHLLRPMYTCSINESIDLYAKDNWGTLLMDVYNKFIKYILYIQDVYVSIGQRTYAVKTSLDDERDVFFVMGLANAVLPCHVSLHFLEFLFEIEDSTIL
jgi:hypothetical protein